DRRDHQPGGDRRELADVGEDHEAAQLLLGARRFEEVARLEGDDGPEAEAGQEQGDEVGRQDEPALLQELLPVEGTAEGTLEGRAEKLGQLTDRLHRAPGAGANAHVRNTTCGLYEKTPWLPSIPPPMMISRQYRL